ncbi:MAG: hypothetical protein AAFW68_02680 [Pseudomonadota bacterium]
MRFAGAFLAAVFFAAGFFRAAVLRLDAGLVFAFTAFRFATGFAAVFVVLRIDLDIPLTLTVRQQVRP